jgi:hypothetical protein
MDCPGYAKPRVRNVKRAHLNSDVCEEKACVRCSRSHVCDSVKQFAQVCIYRDRPRWLSVTRCAFWRQISFHRRAVTSSRPSVRALNEAWPSTHADLRWRVARAERCARYVPGMACAPNRSVVVAIGVRLVVEPRQFCVGAAIRADRLGPELDGAADAHESKEVGKVQI